MSPLLFDLTVRLPTGALLLGLTLLGVSPQAGRAQVIDVVPPTRGASVGLGGVSTPTLAPPELYSNGPFVNAPGAGPVPGTDASVLQSNSFTPPVVALGFRNKIGAGERIADDFQVPEPGWQIQAVVFHEYQTFSGTWPTVNDVRVRIWSGPPDGPSSTIVFGDLTTNRLVSATFDHIYRVPESATSSLSRPVMRVVADVQVELPPGHYWLEWAAGGSVVHTGPFQPPITINGACSTGDAISYDPVSSEWKPIVDHRNTLDTGDDCPQGLPFIIEGVIGSTIDNPPTGPTITLLQPSPNPSPGPFRVTLSVARPQIVRVALFDLQGRQAALLYDGHVQTGQTHLAVQSDLPAGAYVLRAVGDTGSVSQGLTIAH